MSRIYLPTSEQMDDTLTNLARIVGALGTREDVSTWEGVQRAVKTGIAPQIFPVGTQFTVHHSTYGDIVFDVVAHDYLKSAHDENAHTMTIMSHDLITSVQYDSPEAFYYAESALPAGTYNFTLPNTVSSWTADTYQFTLTKSLPKSGQLCINGDANTDLVDLLVSSYANQTTTVTMEISSITRGNGGTNLGTWGTQLNTAQRISYGSNNYKESAIRQFLNSSSDSSGVWNPQTKFDRPPTWSGSTAGFVNGLDADFSNIVAKVKVPCIANTVYESPDSTVAKGEKYVVIDRFHLPNQVEVFGTSDIADDTVIFPYYEGATKSDRIKYKKGSPSNWWTRSPYYGHAHDIRRVSSEGEINNGASSRSGDCAIVCTIA